LPSCKVYRLNSAVPGGANILNRIEREHRVQYGKLGENDDTPLCIYFDESRDNLQGRMAAYSFDRPIALANRDDGEYEVKVTVPTPIQFLGGDLSPLVGIFAGRSNSVSLADALNGLQGAPPILLPVNLDLTSKSDAIRSRFLEIKKFRAEKLKDDKERTASISGIKLEDSQAWTRYVQTMGGELTVLVVRYGSTYVQFANDGSLRFQSAADNSKFVVELIKELRSLGIQGL
jgi:hypothetical protein